MRLDNFSLEILVGGVPLKEYCDEIEEAQTRHSYIRNAQTDQIAQSPILTFVSVQEPSTPFVLRYSAADASKDNVYSVIFYIDGQTDHVKHDISTSSFHFIEGLHNGAGDKILLFSFGVSLWFESESEALSQVPTTSPAHLGGPGIITAVFAPRGTAVFAPRGKRIEPHASSARMDLVQRPLEETKEHRGLKLSVAYSGYKPYRKSQGASQGASRYKRGTPVAVLNLHYRATSVLRAKGHPVLFEQKYPGTRETQAQALEIDDSEGGPSSAVPPPKVIQVEGKVDMGKAETKASKTRAKTGPWDYREEKKVKLELNAEVVVIDSGDEEDGKVIYID